MIKFGYTIAYVDNVDDELTFFDDADVLAAMGVAGLSPLQLFGQAAFQKDLSQPPRFLPPTVGAAE